MFNGTFSFMSPPTFMGRSFNKRTVPVQVLISELSLMKRNRALCALDQLKSLRLVLFTLFIGAFCEVSSAQQVQVDERIIKATYIYNFVQFTVWPAHQKEVFNLCIYGKTPMDKELTKLNGKLVWNRAKIKVTHISNEEDAGFCQMVYLDRTQSHQTELLLRKLASKPIVTVTDADGLTGRGVMIEMGKSQHLMGFEINLEAARQVKVNFNSRLLRLARSVKAG